MIKFKSKIATRDKNISIVSILISGLKEGINFTEDFFIKKKNNKIEWVVNRLCDHNSGKLIIKKNDQNYATCPIHNWKLDLEKLEYTNKIVKKKIKFKIRNNSVEIKKTKKILDFKNIDKQNLDDEKVEVR